MANFKSKEELLKVVNEGFEALNNGSLTSEEMNNLVDASRELYERLLIIRHKSFELLVANQPLSFEKDVPSLVEETTVESTSVTEEEIVNEISEEVHEDENIPADIVEETPQVTVETSTFSVEDKEEGFAFDLFGGSEIDDEIAVTEEIVVEETIEEEEDIIAPFDSEEVTFEEPIHVEEVAVEMPKAIQDIIKDSSFNVGEFVQQEMGVPSEEVIDQEEVTSNVTQVTETPTNTDGDTSFFNTYISIKNNPSASIISPKIESLNGAFGLGEKLMFIRELFNGSSDLFNQTIENLEELNSFEEAKSSLNSIALSNQWNINDQSTVDFIKKIERRFF